MAYYQTLGNVRSVWRAYLNIEWLPTYNAYSSCANVYVGVYAVSKHVHTFDYDKFSAYATGWGTDSWWAESGEVTMTAGSKRRIYEGQYWFDRTHSNRTITISASVTHTAGTESWRGTSSTSQTFTVPAIDSYAVSYNGNKPQSAQGDVTGVPATQKKYYNEYLTLSSGTPSVKDWTFTKWNTSADGSGGTYFPKGSYGANAPLTLYAQWSDNHPPQIESIDAPTYGSRIAQDGSAIKNFSTIDVPFSGASVYTGRTISSVVLTVGSMSQTLTSADITDGSGRFSLSATQNGTYNATVVITDSSGYSAVYEIGSVTIVDPTWSKQCTFTTPPPSVASNGSFMLDSAEVWNYETESWDAITENVSANINNGVWSFPYTFDEAHVHPTNSANPETRVKVSYNHYDIVEKEQRNAFYGTTRNQNFSNGIYNNIFVGGVSPHEFSNYTSRVWWSAINNPLYFPDTNYIEVGSNDTAVQGLTKVGDYLAVIKQSKTTDTAIFLLYPTSFEEETTYAVKQGVQGVGALSRYSFNILGDETLFLSPKGVMAIVPSQDEEHKVQNRSYFVDKRLLAEDGIDNAYSFVFDGKYFLALGNGHCYVLDGNQRNSWGNDRTVLVYECYFLDNVPANCLFKYQDRLAFSTLEEVCVFGDDYVDAFDVAAEEKEPEPVKAEWSTIFDDDGSLHYYKTMQKKGNLVSVLPLENETPYKQIVITEAIFNEDKGRYFVYEDGEYVQCDETDVFSEETDYFIENRSNTKIYVRKDDKDPVEIQRKFGLQSDTPSEMFLNKKFKKYKRLQFILRNEEDENFGVDEIVKNYTVGNYAKK